MTDKFNGFSQDEINRVSSAKKQTAAATATSTSTITSSTEAQMKQAFRGQHTGLRRMPEKWSKTTTTTTTSEQLRKQQQQHTHKTQTSAMPTTTTTTTIANSITGDKMQPTKKTPHQQPAKAQNTEDDTLTEINLNESLSKSLENVLFYQPFKKPNEATKNEQKQSAAASTTPSDDSSILKGESTNSNSETINSSSSDDSSILPMPPHISSESHTMTNGGCALESPFKGISLKDFETHRKMIQEQNKQKKDLLYKAIEQHSKKTAAETRKIEEIKNELAKLDNDLAMDVAILRKQIDNACVHFANVEKQYIKVEAQFLKAKLDLHNAAEKKELLTEHLCTVIAHNEDRKAQQLTELMQKVGLTESGDYEPVPQAAGTRQE